MLVEAASQRAWLVVLPCPVGNTLSLLGRLAKEVFPEVFARFGFELTEITREKS